MERLPEDSTNRWSFVVQVSTAPGMLAMADELLSLAVEHSKHAKALAASVTVILAAALDHGVMNRLQFIAQRDAAVNAADTSGIPFDELLNASLRRRMVSVPKIMSSGEYQLDPNSDYVQRLHELINVRNELLHIQDATAVLNASRGEVAFEGDHVVITGRMPEFRWGSILVEQAKGFREAVGTYFKEVLDIDPEEELSCGRVVGKAPPRG